MAEEFKTTGEPLKEDKIGTKVTYHGTETGPEIDVVYGVAMKKGESVDFAEHMDPAQAKRFAQRLASNPQFEVEGAPRAKPIQSSVQPTADARSAAALVTGERLLAERQGREPPESYNAPLEALLESQNSTKTAGGKTGQQAEAQGEEPASRRSSPPKGR